MLKLLNRTQDLLDATRKVDFLGPLALRLYLVPVFWIAGSNKLAGFDSVVQWFGNTEWGLGLPFPTLMAGLAIGTELIGAAFLLIGFATRWVTIPLLIQMLVAIFQVHAKNGWQAVHDKMSPFASDNVDGAIERLNMAKKLLREHGDYDWLTETGNFIVSNNGVEWAVTYGIMLLALFFIGGGRYVSVDYWIHRKFRK